MDYYKLILKILTISLGIITIALLARKSRANSSKTIEYLAVVFLFYFLWVIMSLAHEYFNIHIKPGVNSDTALIITYIFILAERIIQLIMVYFLVLFVWENILANEKSFSKNTLYKIIMFFCFLLFVGFFLFLISKQGKYFLFTVVTIAFFILCVSLIYFIILIKNAWKLKDTGKRLSLLVLGIGWTLFLIAEIFYTILGLFNIDQWLLNFPIEISFDFSISCLNILWAWKYSHYLSDHKIESVSADVQINIKHLASKYEISKRELEIIELICAGKSNQEIADQLFISLRTVKVHIYNIFIKTDVKSRMQLANLFAENLK